MSQPRRADKIPDEIAGSPKDRSSDPLSARKKAMDYLARREYGGTELVARLEAAGFEPDTAAAAVERLRDEGLQDDRRFVENFTQSRIGQGKGPVRIRLELQRRDVAEGIVNGVLAECGVDWPALAREVRRRKFGAALPADFEDKARQMRFLQYRGFEPDQIRGAVSAPDE